MVFIDSSAGYTPGPFGEFYSVGGVSGGYMDAAPAPLPVPVPDTTGVSTTVSAVSAGAPPTIIDLSTTTYNKTITLSYGDRPISGTFIWSKLKYQDSTGAWFGDFAMSFGFSTAPSATRQLVRMWAEKQIIYDGRVSPATVMQGLNFTFYTGDLDQPQDPLIFLDKGFGTPAFRRHMYVVFNHFPLLNFNNEIPSQVKAEILDASDAFIDTIIPLSLGSVDPQSVPAIDWVNGIAYIIAGTSPDIQLYAYDIDTGTELYHRSVSSPFTYFYSEQLYYLPWLNKLYGWGWTTSTSDEGTEQPTIIDPLTGTTTSGDALTASIHSYVLVDIAAQSIRGPDLVDGSETYTILTIDPGAGEVAHASIYHLGPTAAVVTSDGTTWMAAIENPNNRVHLYSVDRFGAWSTVLETGDNVDGFSPSGFNGARYLVSGLRGSATAQFYLACGNDLVLMDVPIGTSAFSVVYTAEDVIEMIYFDRTSSTVLLFLANQYSVRLNPADGYTPIERTYEGFNTPVPV